MGNGASSEEKLDGSAVTGQWWQRVEMPDRVAAHRFPNSGRKAQRFLAETPSRVKVLNEAKGTTSLYDALKSSLVYDGGIDFFGFWKRNVIHQVVERYQPAFNEKGVGVYFAMARWLPYDSEDHMESRYWLEFYDMAVEKYCCPFSYDPDMNHDLHALPSFDVGEPGQEVVDLTGQWVIDAEALSKEALRCITAGHIDITQTAGVYHMVASLKFAGSYGQKEWKETFPMQPQCRNVYLFRTSLHSCTASNAITFHSATSATISCAVLGVTIPYRHKIVTHSKANSNPVEPSTNNVASVKSLQAPSITGWTTKIVPKPHTFLTI